MLLRVIVCQLCLRCIACVIVYSEANLVPARLLEDAWLSCFHEDDRGFPPSADRPIYRHVGREAVSGLMKYLVEVFQRRHVVVFMILVGGLQGMPLKSIRWCV